jgi:protein tyrosine/serine phosphatase
MLDNQVKTKNFDQVDDFFYRSALPADGDLAYIQKNYGIKTVIDFCMTNRTDEAQTATELGIEYIDLPWSAYFKDSLKPGYYKKIINEFFTIIDDKTKHPILIHCYHGRERTGTLVACYRIAKQGWTANEAIAEMHKYGFKNLHHYDLVLFLKSYARQIKKLGKSS